MDRLKLIKNDYIRMLKKNLDECNNEDELSEFQDNVIEMLNRLLSGGVINHTEVSEIGSEIRNAVAEKKSSLGIEEPPLASDVSDFMNGISLPEETENKVRRYLDGLRQK